MSRVKYIVLALSLSAAFFVLGFLTHRNDWIPAPLRASLRSTVNDLGADRNDAAPFDRQYGEWYPFVSPRRDSVGEVDAESKAALEALGYLTASEPAPEQSGVTRYDESSVEAGLNLYISGHAPEALLMDMKGEVLHKWDYSFYDIWPDYSPPDYLRATGHAYWRRVKVFDNGDLLAIHEGIGLIKLDKDSNLLWAQRGGFHHDFQSMPDGSIYALSREAKVLPRINPDALVLEPLIVVLDAAGNERKRVSLLECFENSKYAPMLTRLVRQGDLFHTNAIEVLGGRHESKSPYFAKGKILISIWSLDAVAIVDIDKQTVDWAATGMWRRQHEPTLLENGNMLVFDNRGNGGDSQILEFDPFTQEIAWAYRGTEQESFNTQWCGAVTRLDNGNTLITETNNGRAFEVTPDGRIVWEFINPHQMPVEDGMTLISSLWEVTRLDAEFGRTWLKPSSTPPS